MSRTHSMVVYHENDDAKANPEKPFEDLIQDEKVWMIGIGEGVINTKSPFCVIGTVNYYLDINNIPKDIIKLIWKYCISNEILLTVAEDVVDDVMLRLAIEERMQFETTLLNSLKNHLNLNYSKDIKQKLKLRELIALINTLINDPRNPDRRMLALGFLENAIHGIEKYIVTTSFSYIMEAKPYIAFVDLLKKISNEGAAILQIQSHDRERCKSLYQDYNIPGANNGEKNKLLLRWAA